jgi:two-component system, chemotaxis family, chemotaxis protein CheY
MTVIPENTSILLLEDVETFRKLMIKDLRKMGITGEIYEAEDVTSALNLCDTKEFQFIISDWNLPDGTGYDFLLKIKERDGLKDLPFVIFSTIDDTEHLLRAIEAGANEFIVKPWIYDELIEKLEFSWTKQQS